MSDPWVAEGETMWTPQVTFTAGNATIVGDTDGEVEM